MQGMFWLAPHIFVCVKSNYFVVLDTKRDATIVLDRGEFGSLAGFINGWPASRSMETADRSGDVQPSPGVQRLLEEMVSSDMLVRDERSGKAANPIRFAHPTLPLCDAYEAKRPILRVRDVSRFILAVCIATLLLRRGSTQELIRRCQRRRDVIGLAINQHPLDVKRAREQVRIFQRLAPLMTKRAREGTIELFALWEFLTARGIGTEIVFGVAVNPLSLHSWLQSDEFALSGPPEATIAFTPILVM